MRLCTSRCFFNPWNENGTGILWEWSTPNCHYVNTSNPYLDHGKPSTTLVKHTPDTIHAWKFIKAASLNGKHVGQNIFRVKMMIKICTIEQWNLHSPLCTFYWRLPFFQAISLPEFDNPLLSTVIGWGPGNLGTKMTGDSHWLSYLVGFFHSYFVPVHKNLWKPSLTSSSLCKTPWGGSKIALWNLCP